MPSPQGGRCGKEGKRLGGGEEGSKRAITPV
jgi:hypothetical protein